MEPNNNPDFRHGYASGVAGVDRETYEGYLSSQVNRDWLSDRIEEKRTELATTGRQLSEVTEASRTVYASLQTHTLQAERLGRQLKQCETDRLALERDLETLRQRRLNASSAYSLLAGLLFLVAGVSFLAGDLIISHEIVAYALNIRNTNEAWTFAIGLAMVSVLLKPAYDRLIETPYLTDPANNRARYERFKLALALFSLLTLAVLGWFRYEAYRTDQLKAAINKSVRQLQLNTAPADPTLATTPTPDTLIISRIEKQLAQSGALNLALVNSPWAMLSFVFSGILFALAGAVCLGIALPVVSAFWFRWLQADPGRWKLRRRLKRLDREMALLDAQWTEQRTRQNVLQHDLDLLPLLADLHHRHRIILTELNDLQTDLKLAHTDSRISNFNDGYDRGRASRSLPVADEQQHPNGTPPEKGQNGKLHSGPPPPVYQA